MSVNKGHDIVKEEDIVHEMDYEDEDEEFLYDDEGDIIDESGFTIRGILTSPIAKQYSTTDLHALIHEGVIDLNPPWQRDVVWSETKQSQLIESLFQNYYIPPVVFAIGDDDGNEVFLCVDGKQRLTSIQKFFDGQLYYLDPRTKKKWYYTVPNSAKKTRLEVPDKWKRVFAQKAITCVEYTKVGNSSVREIFQRVQRGMPLTTAEKLQAIDSPWGIVIGDLVLKHVNVEGGLRDQLDWSTARARDFQCIAQVAFCCAHIESQPRAFGVKLDKWIQDSPAPSSEFKKQLRDALDNMWQIAAEPELNAPFTKVKYRVAPAEFVFIAVLIFAMSGKSLSDMAKAVHNFRKSIRKVVNDVRLRGDIVKVMWEYIDELQDDPGVSLSHIKLPVKGPGRPAAAKPKLKKRGASDSGDDSYQLTGKRSKH